MENLDQFIDRAIETLQWHYPKASSAGLLDIQEGGQVLETPKDQVLICLPFFKTQDMRQSKRHYAHAPSPSQLALIVANHWRKKKGKLLKISPVAVVATLLSLGFTYKREDYLCPKFNFMKLSIEDFLDLHNRAKRRDAPYEAPLEESQSLRIG